MRAGAAAERDRREQLHPPAERRGRRPIATWCASTCRSATPTTSSSATSAATASASCRAGSAACSTARRRRRGAGTSSTRTRWWAAGTRCSARASSTSRGCRMPAAPTTAQQDPFGQSGMEQIGFKGVPNDPTVAGGIVGIDIDGHIRLGSPNFMPKFQHTSQVQWMNTTTWMRGSHQIKFGVDLMMPMTNEYFDVAPTRGNLRFQATFTGNALRRLPDRLSESRRADQRVRRHAAAVVELVLRAGRLEADRQADAQPRAALRLHAAGDRERQPHGELRSERQRRPWRAGVRQRRLARRSRARQPGQEQLRAAHRRDLSHQRQHAAARRLRHVLQPVRSHRLRGSARPQPAGAAQHPGQLDGQHRPGVPDAATGSRRTTSIRRTW